HVHAHADALHDARVLLFRTDDGRYTVALVESQVAAHEALERLAAQLAVGATFAVLLGSLLAFSLARAALRPVERLRTEAARGGVEDGDVVLPVPPARDEVARLAVTLNELLGRMRAATLHERRFVAEAGHELRTPLATIIAEIELALEEDPPPNVAATLESLHAEALRLAALAEQLLQLSTIAERTTVQPVDLAALVADRVRRARLIHPERDIRVGRTVPGRFLADPQGMQQALDNLVANAAAHGGRGVVVDLREAEEHLAVHVLDDGPGIDAETAARAFDRFARASEARARPGTGLGLSIVHAIATAHAGTAGIGPRTDGWPGTDAWFTLRAQLAADEA
ncbi:MAG: integral rane sensor signal transduction histidine kinase, partial [Thermoleophilia bacterium]|nr:integral rane sensor signal transduction histidine kinase [Thermoleophilia bacterium]